MGLELQIVCSLDESEKRKRAGAWADALRRSKTIDEIDGGLLVRFPADDLDRELRELADAEADCCRWMNLELSEGDGATELRITSATADGEAAIRQIFRAGS